MPQEKSDSIKKLDEWVEKFKAQECFVVYCLARYDGGEGMTDAVFHTRISLSDKVNTDAEFGQSVFRSGHGLVPDELLEDLVTLRNEGWSVGFYCCSPERARCDWGELSEAAVKAEKGHPDENHVTLDMLRELVVAWNNATHKDYQLGQVTN